GATGPAGSQGPQGPPGTFTGSFTGATTFNGGPHVFQSGLVGIGMSTPFADLQIAPNSNRFALAIEQGANGDGLLAYVNTTSSTRTVFTAASNVSGLTLYGNGNVAIGPTTPTARLAVRGNGTDVLIGDAGCGPSTGAIGFGTMSGCRDFALAGISGAVPET